jgi:N-acetylglucosaminyldiphosphoundecaprenol N-acetyl-beta-D-mannosaminyltransferase
MNQFRTENLLGVRFHLVDKTPLLGFIAERLESKQKTNLFNINIYAMNLAYESMSFKRVINSGDLVFVDGYGVKLGAKIANVPTGQRLTPMDWIDDLFGLSAEKKAKIFILGDVDEELIAFQHELRKRHPGCELVGYHHGFFDRKSAENDQVVDIINQSGADILLVGMSMPIQETWISDNSAKLQPTIRMATGAMHRVYTGRISRAPKWVTDNGFEWLYRFCMEPKKTWKRYLLGNPLFILRIILNYRVKKIS